MIFQIAKGTQSSCKFSHCFCILEVCSGHGCQKWLRILIVSGWWILTQNSLKFLAIHAVLRCGVLLHAVEEKTQNANLLNHLTYRTWPFVLKFSEQGIKLKTVSSFPSQSGLMGSLAVVNVESWPKQKLTHSLVRKETLVVCNSWQ